MAPGVITEKYHRRIQIMFRPNRMQSTTLRVNASTPGDTLEKQVEALISRKEPLDEGSTPLIYTPRYEGIRASTNIRTDRWEVAIEATEKIAKSYLARREERMKKAQPEAVPGQPEAQTQTQTPDSTP